MTARMEEEWSRVESTKDCVNLTVASTLHYFLRTLMLSALFQQLSAFLTENDPKSAIIILFFVLVMGHWPFGYLTRLVGARLPSNRMRIHNPLGFIMLHLIWVFMTLVKVEKGQHLGTNLNFAHYYLCKRSKRSTASFLSNGFKENQLSCLSILSAIDGLWHLFG